MDDIYVFLMWNSKRNIDNDDLTSCVFRTFDECIEQAKTECSEMGLEWFPEYEDTLRIQEFLSLPNHMKIRIDQNILK